MIKLGHFDSVILSLNTDPNSLPVKGFVAWTNFVLRAFNSVCDCESYKNNQFKETFMWKKDRKKAFGMLDRIEPHALGC